MFVARLTVDGISFATVENAFQAAKTEDAEEKTRIAATTNPVVAKRLGRRVRLRPDWEGVKDKVMLEMLRLKFADPVLAARLLATGDAELVEGNRWHDNYWGSCACEKCGNRGENKLGRLLMKVREELAGSDQAEEGW